MTGYGDFGDSGDSSDFDDSDYFHDFDYFMIMLIIVILESLESPESPKLPGSLITKIIRTSKIFGGHCLPERYNNYTLLHKYYIYYVCPCHG